MHTTVHENHDDAQKSAKLFDTYGDTSDAAVGVRPACGPRYDASTIRYVAMAFFSAVSSSIGKKLLLYGLRQIDILDKDPVDFVSVDVGKRTTLEVRDVGLHVNVRVRSNPFRNA